MKWARKKPTHTVSRKRTLHALAGLISMAILTTACTTAPYGRLPPAESANEVPQAASEVTPVVKPEVRLRLVVSKAARELIVYLDGKAVETYAIGLGFRPQGRKRWQGDGRTPEGDYAVAIKNPHSKYFLSLGLNYPTPADAAQGYTEGRIDREEYRAIKFAYNEGKVPPWNTRLGGEIFIHGHGASRDWTRGCIALDNEDMRELYGMVDVGTPVTILP
jgi:murein L,D-transpeptidase YafK